VDRASVRAVESAVAAVIERRDAGVDPVPVRVADVPSRYVAGQETALVHWLNGGDAKPTRTPPRPFDKGVRGRPTLSSNAETYAHLALIARFGAAWYRGLGTDADPGSALVSVTGAVERPGVYEIPLGTHLSEVVDAAGGAPGRTGAFLVGGYFGTWLPVAAARTPLAVEPLRALGASIGAGVVGVLPADACGLAETARLTRWLAGQSAGQCGPCALGLPDIAGALDAVVAGDRRGDAHAQLVRWLAMVEGRGACQLPDGTAHMVRSALSVFAADLDQHRRRGPCAPHAPVFPTPAPGGWR
jgi:NADH:ubiquinone oxidoreductase subunit F (NADH-binding)